MILPDTFLATAFRTKKKASNDKNLICFKYRFKLSNMFYELNTWTTLLKRAMKILKRLLI